MPTGAGAAIAHCVHCRADISVPAQYAHGDHIVCGACKTNHKVVRGDRLRLVLADVTPLREALEQNQHLINRLYAELAQARASFGIGANGIGIAVVFVVYEVGWKDMQLSLGLFWNAVGIAVVSGLLLEAANWAFLAKRSAITRLSQEIAEAQAESQRIRQQIRDATRF
jgi:uncharacterized membrane protein